MAIDISRLVENLDSTLQLPCSAKPRVNENKTHHFCQEIYLKVAFGPRMIAFERPFPLAKIKARPVTLDVQATWTSRSEAVKAYVSSMNTFFDSEKFGMTLGNTIELKEALQQLPLKKANELQLIKIRLVLRLEDVFESLSEGIIPLYDLGLLTSQYVDLWGRSQHSGGDIRRLLF